SILSVLRPAVVVMIAISGIKILESAFGINGFSMENFKIHMLAIFIICMVLLLKYNKNPIFVMVLAGLLNLFYNVLFL
ncbi:MAG: chromate transporter, partial [Lachnoanaerobaculum gingivalis]